MPSHIGTFGFAQPHQADTSQNQKSQFFQRFYYLCKVKYLSFILALYILILSVAPTIVEDKCLQEQTTEQGQSEQDQDCSDCCSPFMGCHTCNGFTFPTATFSLKSVIVYSEKKIPLYKDNFSSDFFPSIWQPPKIS